MANKVPSYLEFMADKAPLLTWIFYPTNYNIIELCPKRFTSISFIYPQSFALKVSDRSLSLVARPQRHSQVAKHSQAWWVKLDSDTRAIKHNSWRYCAKGSHLNEWLIEYLMARQNIKINLHLMTYGESDLLRLWELTGRSNLQYNWLTLHSVDACCPPHAHQCYPHTSLLLIWTSCSTGQFKLSITYKTTR